MEFAFDEQRERLAHAVMVAVGPQVPTSTGETAARPFDRDQWDRFCRGPGAAVMADITETDIGSAASVVAALEALGHAAGPDTACLAFACQLAGVLHPLVRGGSPQQRSDWLERLITGEAFGVAVAPARLGERITAMRSNDGLVINGSATVASFGRRPDCLVVPVSAGVDGVDPAALLLLPVDPCPELEWNPSTQNSLAPDNVLFRALAVSEDRILLGGKADGAGAIHAQAVFCLSVHAMRIGLLRRLGDMVIQAARTASRRMKLTGRPPARFQALTHPIADFIVRCDAARLLVHEGACRLDTGERVPAEALLAAFNMDTALSPYAAAVVGLQRHWGLAEDEDWCHLLAAATALGRYAWSPVELSERVCSALRERPRPW